MPEFASYPSLKGRTVFVSGGGSGIGASIVEHFAAQGAKVASSTSTSRPRRRSPARPARCS
jgi:NAD(P)-dependent dehydrogenase (short-subunit alcohol dehydrogenase family)